jgi:hypothetical protein
MLHLQPKSTTKILVYILRCANNLVIDMNYLIIAFGFAIQILFPRVMGKVKLGNVLVSGTIGFIFMAMGVIF